VRGVGCGLDVSLLYPHPKLFIYLLIFFSLSSRLDLTK
jgi:hypothetical protein